MQYIKKCYESTLEVKQSKFIAHLVPYANYEETLRKLQEDHPKARHFVTAFRYLNEFKQIVESSSDDGEPKGTSGKPALMVLQGKELINTAVIVVRYFGGTKLGTGGLVRAYSDAVNEVIQKAELLEYKEMVQKRVYFSYGDIRLVEYECENFGVTIKEKKFQQSAAFLLEAPTEDMLLLLQKLQRVVDVE
jgi:uncharacterized YigZ family protein